ncbi:MAG: hypothetical protein ABEJ24_03175 [Candidatus Magasanikbacteria bacterium]
MTKNKMKELDKKVFQAGNCYIYDVRERDNGDWRLEGLKTTKDGRSVRLCGKGEHLVFKSLSRENQYLLKKCNQGDADSVIETIWQETTTANKEGLQELIQTVKDRF